VAVTLVPVIGLHAARADLDVNAVAGVVKIDGSPAPAGTSIRILDTSNGQSVTTSVDSSNVPPFQRGEGRYDTGDVPAFSTGDRVVVSVSEGTVYGDSSKTLSAGTTTVNLNANRDNPPSMSRVPDQEGYEDEPWELDLDPYISDPDTGKPGLTVIVYSDHVDVEGHTLVFQYPEGVTEDTVVVYVKDAHSTSSGQIAVSITPVNDPPSLAEIPELEVTEDSTVSIDLAPYVTDPDHDVEELTWTVLSPGCLSADFEGSRLDVHAGEGQFGQNPVSISVMDPGGLCDNGTVAVNVQANTSAMTAYYEAQIRELNLQIAELTDENSYLTDQVSQLESQVADLEQSNLELEGLIEDAQNEASLLQAQLNELEGSAETIELLESERSDLEEELASLQGSINSTIEGYESTINELNGAKAKAEALVIQLQDQVSTLEVELAEAESNRSLQGETVANLSVQNSELQARISEREGQIASLEATVDDLEMQIAELEGEKEEVLVQVEQLRSNLESAEDENADLQERIEQLSTTAPARLVEGNRSSNTTQEDQGLLRSLVAKGAHFASDSYSVVSAGMNNGLVILMMAVVVISSAVAIAARTSWLNLSMGGGSGSAQDYWRNIKTKTMNKERAGTSPPAVKAERPKEPKKELPETRPAPKSESKKSAFFLTRKPGINTRRSHVAPAAEERAARPEAERPRKTAEPGERPEARESRIEIKRSVPRERREVKLPRTEARPSATRSHVEERSEAGERRTFVTPRTEERHEVKTRTRSHVQPPAAEREKVERPAVRPEKEPAKESPLDLSGLSETDRQYVESLIEFGYEEEAREEVAKRLAQGKR
jgi:cell division protein FtsB